MKDPVIVSWSGGKDSVLSLYKIIRDDTLKPVGLLTTVTKEYNRVSMHGVRSSLIEKQASILGIPLHKVYIPKDCSNEQYERIMGKAISEYKNRGIKGLSLAIFFLKISVDIERKNSSLKDSKCTFLFGNKIQKIWSVNSSNLILKQSRLV